MLTRGLGGEAHLGECVCGADHADRDVVETEPPVALAEVLARDEDEVASEISKKSLSQSESYLLLNLFCSRRGMSGF